MASLEEVDRVEILSVVDNSIDILMASTEGVRRLPRHSIESWSKDEYPFAEHGFSVLMRIVKGKRIHTILFDAGFSEKALVHNAELMDVELEAIESIVLSHSHPDHTGGLLGLIKEVGRRRLPLILHPNAFRKRKVMLPGGTSVTLEPPNRQVLADIGLEISERPQHSLLLDNSALVTGEIVRTTDFEKGFPTHYAEVDGRWEPDPLILDDQAAVVNVKGKGLVIVTGCGHAGIVNTIKHAQAVTGVNKVHAVMGGLHLSGQLFESIIPQTVKELRQIGPDVLIPSHCSGWKAVHALREALPDTLVQNSVGTLYTL